MRIVIQRPPRRKTRRDAQPFLGTYLRDVKAADEREARSRRLAKLDRDIAALERWHHVWRLTHDADYRELYADELEERRSRMSASLAPDHHGTTVEERQAATRRMAQWGRQK